MQYIYVDPVPSTTINFKVPSANTASRSVVLTAKPCFFVALSLCDHHDNCCTKNNSKTTKIEQDQGSGDLGDAAELVASRTKKQGTLFGHRTATVPLSVDDVGKAIITTVQCCNDALLNVCNVAVFQMLQCCNVADTSAVYQRVL